jgi:Flp pilus assembly protein TadB
MPEWLGTALLALAGTGLLAGAAILGSLMTAKANKRATAVQVEAAQASRENALIDQLQEELAGHREATNTRLVAQEKRMNAQEERTHEVTRERDAYRDHAHELRSHIWDGKPPPPPDWPTGLPR